VDLDGTCVSTCRTGFFADPFTGSCLVVQNVITSYFANSTYSDAQILSSPHISFSPTKPVLIVTYNCKAINRMFGGDNYFSDGLEITITFL